MKKEQEIKEDLKRFVKSTLLGNFRAASKIGKHRALAADARDAMDRADNIKDPAEWYKKVGDEGSLVKKHTRAADRLEKAYKNAQLGESDVENDSIEITEDIKSELEKCLYDKTGCVGGKLQDTFNSGHAILTHNGKYYLHHPNGEFTKHIDLASALGEMKKVHEAVANIEDNKGYLAHVLETKALMAASRKGENRHLPYLKHLRDKFGSVYSTKVYKHAQELYKIGQKAGFYESVDLQEMNVVDKKDKGPWEVTHYRGLNKGKPVSLITARHKVTGQIKHLYHGPTNGAPKMESVENSEDLLNEEFKIEILKHNRLKFEYNVLLGEDIVSSGFAVTENGAEALAERWVVAKIGSLAEEMEAKQIEESIEEVTPAAALQIAKKYVRGDLFEAKKKIGEYTHENGHVTKVYHHTGMDDEGDPYVVKLFKPVNGKLKHYEPADYFTNDHDDAHSTAQHMVRESVDSLKSSKNETGSADNKKIKAKQSNRDDGDVGGYFAALKEKYGIKITDDDINNMKKIVGDGKNLG